MSFRLAALFHRAPFVPRIPGTRRKTSKMTVPAQNGHLPPPAKLQDRSKLIPFSSRLQEGRALAEDVWSVFNAANLPDDCINLGQGYMNFGPPKWVTAAANEALQAVGPNHYSHPKGRPRLRQAIKDFYEPSFGRELDINSEILVTSGANEGCYSVFVAFLEHGDEVIMFEPFFDQYLPSVTFNGGNPIYVPLHPPTNVDKPTSKDWTIDFDELRRAITPRTKMIIINTPHNPVGKVFTRQELEKIAVIAEEHNLLVMADEVYDCLVFDDHEHVRFATLPGMWDRTVTAMSAGKAFSATGWRVGWLVGPPSIIMPTLAASTRIVFCTNSPLQEAVAAGLEQAKARGFFEQQTKEYLERRATIVGAFDKLGIKYTQPEGAYFVMLDISGIKIPDNYPFPASLNGRGRDFKACWFMATHEDIKVSTIPVSEFYCEEHCNIGENYVRVSFCKDNDTMKAAGERFQGLKKFLTL